MLSLSEGGTTYAFAYDGCGNPTQYKSTVQNMWWTRGRMLERYNKGSADVTYKYDLNGNRVSKTVQENGETTEYKYYTEDGTILREERKTGGETQSLVYRYGTDGIIGFRYGNAEYYYRRNMQGDIAAIYDAAGNLKGEYRYGAYGDCEIVRDEGGIASLNPYRYRGYYYDAETGLYYLKSRYYDGELGRFISADDIDAAEMMKTEPGGLNLYAYCLNDPVNTTDPDGDMPWWQKLLVGVAVIAAVAVVAVATGGSGLVGAIAVGAVKGAVAGAISGAVLGGAIGGVTAAVKGEDVMQGVLNGAADGFMSGAITGAITGGMQGAASFMKSSKMMGSLDEASQLAKKPKTNPLCSKDCFVAGTMVKTEGGYKAIEEIEVGDKVWSWDEATGEQALKTVVQLFRNTKTVKTKVTIESEDGTTDEIVSTPGHKYYLPLNRVNRNPKEELEHASYEGLTEQWVSANDLKAGDRVVLAQTGGLTERVKYGIVKAVKTEESESYTTYNFEVEDYHTYFVGKTSVCVHNAGCSVNQMNQLIKKGKAPKGVKRIDSPKVKGEQIHAHLDRGSAINIDGTLKHGNGQELTVSIAEWLRSFGWKL